MKIPRIVHQTWKDENIPTEFQECVESWKANLPGWEFWLWTDWDNRSLIEEHYSWALNLYDRYPLPIQRVDAVRYFILYHFGGLYVDLDFFAIKPVDQLFEKKCVLPLVDRKQAANHDRDKIISNALMGSVPGHAFFETVINELPRYEHPKNAQNLVLESTGPFMLTDVYEKFPHKDTIQLMPSEALFPLTVEEADEVELADLPELCPRSFAVHMYAGTWWRNTDTG